MNIFYENKGVKATDVVLAAITIYEAAEAIRHCLHHLSGKAKTKHLDKLAYEHRRLVFMASEFEADYLRLAELEYKAKPPLFSSLKQASAALDWCRRNGQ